MISAFGQVRMVPVFLCLGVLLGLSIPFGLVHALTVSPVKLEVYGDAGTTVGGTFKLYNEQESEQTFYVSYASFEAQGESGQPHFTEAKEGLPTWVRMDPMEDSTVTLAPSETRELSYLIDIPDSAKPGGYFGAIFWGTAPTQGIEEEIQVSLGAKVGILLFLRVNGEFEEGGGLLSWGLGSGKSVQSFLPTTLSYRVQNSGADRFVAEGSLEWKPWLAKKTTFFDLNAEGSNVMPASTRLFEESLLDDLAFEDARARIPETFFKRVKAEWSDFHFGPYTAVFTLTLPDEVVTEKKVFWVIPWELMSVVGAGVLCFGGFFRWRNRVLRRKILAEVRKEKPIKKTGKK
jgi:hypothetical protein